LARTLIHTEIYAVACFTKFDRVVSTYTVAFDGAVLDTFAAAGEENASGEENDCENKAVR